MQLSNRCQREVLHNLNGHPVDMKTKNVVSREYVRAPIPAPTTPLRKTMISVTCTPNVLQNRRHGCQKAIAIVCV